MTIRQSVDGALLHLSPGVFSRAVSFSRAAISRRPRSYCTIFFTPLVPSPPSFLPFFLFVPTLSFFRARNHRERAQDFHFSVSQRESVSPHLAPFPCPPCACLSLLPRARFARNGPKLKSQPADRLLFAFAQRAHTRACRVQKFSERFARLMGNGRHRLSRRRRRRRRATPDKARRTRNALGRNGNDTWGSCRAGYRRR